MRGTIIIGGAIMAGVVAGILRSGTVDRESPNDLAEEIEEELEKANRQRELKQNAESQQVVDRWLQKAMSQSDQEFWYGDLPSQIVGDRIISKLKGQTRTEFIAEMNARYGGLRNIVDWTFIDTIDFGNNVIVNVSSTLPNGKLADSVWEFQVLKILGPEPEVTRFKRSLEHDKNFQKEIAKENKLVDNWLNAMRKGRDGIEFWHREHRWNATRLFAVRDWEVVDTDQSGGNPFTVRVSSSTRGGMPIEKLWTIKLANDRMDVDDDVGIKLIEETVND